MDDRRALIWSLRKHFDWDLRLFCLEADVRALACKTRQTGESLRAAECLYVFLEHLVGRGTPRKTEHFNFVWVFDRSRILRRKIRNKFWTKVTVMAGVAGHRTHTLEVVLVDSIHHQHHSARRFFQWRLVGKPVPSTDAFRSVTIDTVQAQGGGKHPHRVHEFVYRNALEHLDILEHLFRHLRPLLLPGLAACEQHNAHQNNDNCTDGAKNHSIHSELRSC